MYDSIEPTQYTTRGLYICKNVGFHHNDFKIMFWPDTIWPLWANDKFELP